MSDLRLCCKSQPSSQMSNFAHGKLSNTLRHQNRIEQKYTYYVNKLSYLLRQEIISTICYRGGGGKAQRKLRASPEIEIITKSLEASPDPWRLPGPLKHHSFYCVYRNNPILTETSIQILGGKPDHGSFSIFFDFILFIHSFFNEDLDYSFNHILYLWGK